MKFYDLDGVGAIIRANEAKRGPLEVGFMRVLSGWRSFSPRTIRREGVAITEAEFDSRFGTIGRPEAPR